MKIINVLNSEWLSFHTLLLQMFNDTLICSKNVLNICGKISKLLQNLDMLQLLGTER
jgi:hypothetical protein